MKNMKNALIVNGQAMELSEAQANALLSIIAASAKLMGKPDDTTTPAPVKEAASKAPKAPEAAPVKAEKATAPKGAKAPKAQAPTAKAVAAYKHGEIKVTADGKSVSFTYGDTGSRVNDSRIYGKFRELGGVWNKEQKVYTFASAKKAAEVAAQMDHFKVIQ